MRPRRLGRQHDTLMLNVSAFSRVGSRLVETQCGAGDVVGGSGHRDRGLALQRVFVGTGEPVEILEPNEFGRQLGGVGHHRAHAGCVQVGVNPGHPVDRLAAHRIRFAHVFAVDGEYGGARRQRPGRRPARLGWTSSRRSRRSTASPPRRRRRVCPQQESTAAPPLPRCRLRGTVATCNFFPTCTMQICLPRRVSPGRRNSCCNSLDPANRANPYAVYAQFRDRGPMQLPDGNLTVFSTYRDCDEVLRHPSSSVDRFKSTIAQTHVRRGRDGATAGAAEVSVSRSARSHPAAQTGQQGVRAQSGQRVAARYHRAGRRIARPDRRAGPLRRQSKISPTRCRWRSSAGCWVCRSRTSRSSAAPRHCWRRRWTRSSRSPARRRTACTSASEPGSGCGIPARLDRAAPLAARRRSDVAV